MLEADASLGFTAGVEALPPAFAALRGRFLGVADGLDPGDWGRQSRCELWTVHDVVRHVRDACRLHVGHLRREPDAFLDEPFDARRTPLRWLERSEGESPETTIAELRALGDDEAGALGARLGCVSGEVVTGPYGPLHWTILTTHVLWDAWIHLRGVTASVGGGDPSMPVEDELVALYGLLIASVPAVALGHRFEATVALVTGDGREYGARVQPGRVQLRGQATGREDLHGDLATVVDALAGRGSRIELVLRGEQDVREPLTWLRKVLVPEP